MKVEDLSLTIRGSEGIDFREGSRTGDMTQSGISVDTVWYGNAKGKDINRKFGGCIDREQALQLRDFINECESKWNSE
jgi:hypothetical protein